MDFVTTDNPASAGLSITHEPSYAAVLAARTAAAIGNLAGTGYLPAPADWPGQPIEIRHRAGSSGQRGTLSKL